MADELLCQPSDVIGAWPAFATLPPGEQTALIAAGSQKIINFCRRGFISQLVTESLDGNGLSRLWLSRRPIISVLAITINGTAVDNTSGKEWSFDAKSGELRYYDGLDDLRFGRRFAAGRNNVIVQYWAGYATVPDPIVRATIWTVRWLRDQTKISGIYSAERIGDYNYTLNTMAFSMTLPQHIAALCADYVQDDGPL